MKTIVIVILLAGLFLESRSQTVNPDYDPAMAKSFGADDYGMKTYIFVILKTGPAKIESRQIRDSLISGHLKNIERMEDEGKLLVAGPLGENSNSYSGIFIFNVTTRKEAEELLKTDPAIKAGVFDSEIYEWYGSAALGEYLKIHKKITRLLF